ncbi:chemotaxis protein [Mediterraneibacter sp.]
MPVGSPKPQTVATAKYEKKAGWMSKSYKLKKEIVEEYAEACKKADVSAAGQLMKMMREFIEEVNKER